MGGKLGISDKIQNKYALHNQKNNNIRSHKG